MISASKKFQMHRNKKQKIQLTLLLAVLMDYSSNYSEQRQSSGFVSMETRESFFKILNELNPNFMK